MAKIRYGFKVDRDRLKAARLIGKGWRQSDLSAATGLSVGAICRIERGVHTPQLGTVGKLAKALNLQVNDLVQWESNLQAHYLEDRKAG